ncbi:MAG TPA: alpha-ketoglutarate-dependent dioxygenase AlkB [Planctomycetota bacterium]|nr:alpha-ketoglutarate-dependent dioxygenase AlkB [Planctomycetota bacterium]
MQQGGQESLIDEWLATGAESAAVPGWRLIGGYIDEDDERALVAEIDAHPFGTDWKRRVQVYGAGYGDDEPAAPLPPLIRALGERIHRDGLIERAPENAVVNEYLPGIGIGPHRDYGAFGPTVVGVSLLSWCVIDLIETDGARRVSVPLPPRSLYVIGGEARTRWKHGIAARRNDIIGGLRVPRQRRLSITWRTRR